MEWIAKFVCLFAVGPLFFNLGNVVLPCMRRVQFDQSSPSVWQLAWQQSIRRVRVQLARCKSREGSVSHWIFGSKETNISTKWISGSVTKRK